MQSVAKGPSNMCEIRPMFKPHDGKLEQFQTEIIPMFVSGTVANVQAGAEEACLHYNFTFNEEDGVFTCREAYDSAAGILKHFENVDAQLKAALAVSDLVGLEIHGPPEELAKLKEPLKDLSIKYFQQL